MSLHEQVPSLSLAPVSSNDLPLPFALSSYWRFLRWAIWNPSALEHYIANRVINPATVGLQAPWETQTWWRWSTWRAWGQARAPVQTFLYSLLTAIGMLLLLIEFAAVLLTLTSLPPSTILDNLFFSTAIGVVLLLLFFGLLGFLANEWAPTIIWGIYYGLGLPILFLHEMWMKDGVTEGDIWFLVEFDLVCGLVFGLMLNSITSTLAKRFLHQKWSWRLIQLMAWILGILFFFVVVLYNRQYIEEAGLIVTVSCAALALVVASAAMFRLDDFLLAAWRLPNPNRPSNGTTSTSAPSSNHRLEEQLQRCIPRVTYMTPKRLSLLLEDWLEQNWEQGIANAYQLWRYTNLQHLVVRKIQKALQETPPSELLEKIETMRTASYQWQLEEFISEPGSYTTLKLGIRHYLGKVRSWSIRKQQSQAKRRKERRLDLKIEKFSSQRSLIDQQRIETPWQAALAGFVYAQQHSPQKAAAAFAKVKGSNYAAELQQIHHTLTALIRSENLAHAEPVLPAFKPPKQPRHPATWDALKLCQEIIHYAWLYRHSQLLRRDEVRQEINHKIEQLLNRPNRFDEDSTIAKLAQRWQIELIAWFAENEMLKPKEAPSPYCYTEPLRTARTFQGCSTQLQEIKRAWTPGQLQPLFVYGQPLIGKTSLLYNAALVNSPSVAVAMINVGLLNRGSDMIRRLLLHICTEIERAVFHTIPNTAAIEQQMSGNPYQFTNNYIRDICHQMGNRILVIVLDNIETLLLLQNFTKTSDFTFTPAPAAFDQFMDNLWHLFNHVPNFTVVFVTNHMPSQRLPISQNFLNVARPLKIGYLEEKAVTTLLQEPVPNFLLRFAQSAVTSIYRLTAGQPFLIQLLGSCLVQRYNRCLKTEQPLDPIFSCDDVEQIINSDPEFLQQSNWYFTHLLDHLSTVDATYPSILRTLVARSRGLGYSQIRSEMTTSGIDVSRLQQQLQFLKDYEVIFQENRKWVIRIGLFRR